MLGSLNELGSFSEALYLAQGPVTASPVRLLRHTSFENFLKLSTQNINETYHHEPHKASCVGDCLPGMEPNTVVCNARSRACLFFAAAETTQEYQKFPMDTQVYLKRGDRDEKGNKVKKRYVICCVERVNGQVKYCLKNKPKNKGGKTIKKAEEKDIAKWQDTVEYSTDDNAER